MTRREVADRHASTASSGADSWKSTDTVKNIFSSGRRGTTMRISTDKEQRSDKDVEVSPNSVPQLSSGGSRARQISHSIAPWDNPPSNVDFSNFRKDLARADGPGGRIPQISRQPPSISSPGAPWVTNLNGGGSSMPSSIFGSFYDDSNEDFGQLSPGFRPGSSQEDMLGFPPDDRRPSIASATTVSSMGSKSSANRAHKKLQGFFGEEFPGMEDGSRQNSNSSLPPTATFPPSGDSGPRAPRHRNNSVNTGSTLNVSRPASPTNISRPRSPYSSEVTPWEFQDSKNAPPSSSETNSIKSSTHRRGLHLPGHKHSKSKEESKAQEPPPPGPMLPMLRPTLSREDSYNSLQRGDTLQYHTSLPTSAMPSKGTLNPGVRPTSPAPSASGSFSSVGPKSPMNGGRRNGRSFFDKIRGKKGDHSKGHDVHGDMSVSIPSTSLQQPRSTREKSVALPIVTSKKTRVDSFAQKGSPFMSAADGGSGKKKRQRDQPVGRDPNEASIGSQPSGALWQLDTDLKNMEGIIASKPPMTPPAGTEIFAGFPGPENKDAKQGELPAAAAWDAPDSWIVRKVPDENMSRIRELDENGLPLAEENTGPPYRVRIFRADSTFAVLSVGLNTTVAEIIGLIGKKTFLQDDLENYHVVMRKHDTSRQLDPQERPLVIQKRLLEQAGYTEADRIEDIGGEDNSYLCRFTFLPARLTGITSLEKDPGFNKMQKFSHIDLQGRNLITIPITLYQKATEIISLNLSRNLNLDVPKDFIQACTNLRELKYTSNEAWKLPPSVSLAARLTHLDISNNKLEHLDRAELNKLQGLVSLRLSNNKLTALPKYFGQYKVLRSLNLASNSLTQFPDYMCEIKTLADLDISFNTISELPNIGNLTALERLWATNNKLSGSFPASAVHLQNLKEIDIRHNGLDNIDVLAQLPNLEYLYVGHNSITAFEGTFARILSLHLNHNPVTRFGIVSPIPSLSSLNLEKAKLAALPDDIFQKMSGLKKLNLDQNHFVSLSPLIGRLTALEHLNVARNLLSSLPADIGRLTELRTLDLRENNLSTLPSQIWFCRKLETLNVSSNVLTAFPKPGAPLPALQDPQVTTPSSNGMPLGTPAADGEDGLGNLEAFQMRRPSQASGYASNLSSSPNQSRKGSVSSAHTQQSSTPGSGAGRKASTTTQGTITPMTRKDSSISTRFMNTFAVSLRHLFLADNRLPDDSIDELQFLPELRILNLSYNLIYDFPQRVLRRWPHLSELYLSGNDLTCLPSEDLEEISGLRVLHINNNKFQVLPAEIAKIQKLAIMDVGSNLLKYNVSNWPYDWNWNWNHNLKYLNLSGNKRLEIKPGASYTMSGRGGKDLTDFTSLKYLRVLGLMDVTLMIQSVPDQNEDRRVRTAGSQVGSMAYGMADFLGRNEHLSTMDMVVDRFRSHEDEAILGMFDGQTLSSGGSKIAKYLYENFKHRFADELEKKQPEESAADALRRTYLGLNKEIALAATNINEHKVAQGGHRPSIATVDFSEEDLRSGCVATVLYVKETELFVSNVGDATALLIDSEGGHKVITRKHDPTDTSERQRIRNAGGFVSRHGKLNDVLEVSRAFGYTQFSPSVIAAPHVSQITLKDTDEMILIASRELWNVMTREFAVDVARQERGDLMRAAQKLRDLAIAFGVSNKIMVMILGVSDLRRKERLRYRTHSMSMGPSDDYYQQRKNRGRMKDAVDDSKLARLDQEIDAPTGEVSLVFTDIKNSTLLWETYPIAMRSAIKMHNEVMRRHLRIIGGYEVKTEGDAFMVSFPTVTSALLWCFTIQNELLNVPWPQEILNSVNGQEVCDADGNVIFRGLSVRMGIHWGTPVCEVDPVTKRMDYFGPMVNRAARISSVADGGQITVSSDFIAEIQRLLETHIESDRSSSTGSEETIAEDMLNQTIRRELRSLSSQGFEVKDLGERRLKGLENPEYIYLMYPHALSSRLLVQQQRAEAEAAAAQAGPTAPKAGDGELTVDTENVWQLWNVSLRLEMLCSTLECPGAMQLKAPETALLERMKERSSEITDRFLINFVEHQISRIETCVTTLHLRNMFRPFRNGMLTQSCPMSEIFEALTSSMQELQLFKQSADFEMAPS